MTIGQTYHIYNGFAKTVDNLWMNNSELTGVVEYASGLTELEFTLETGETIVIDSELMNVWDVTNKARKGYMFIEKQK
jgi:hypothetical protein